MQILWPHLRQLKQSRHNGIQCNIMTCIILIASSGGHRGGEASDAPLYNSNNTACPTHRKKMMQKLGLNCSMSLFILCKLCKARNREWVFNEQLNLGV